MLRCALKVNNWNNYRYLFFCNFTSTSKFSSQESHKEVHRDFEKYSALLSKFGFNYGQINRIVKSPVSVITYGENELLSNLTHWLKFGFRDKLLTALCAYPELLTLNPEFINFRTKELMTLFTKKDIEKLLVTCPSVFLDNFSDVYGRVEYIVHMMGVEQKSIVKSRALQFDLNHIKCRHLFMLYAGRYNINKKSSKSKNPPLNKIFSRNIQTYLKLCNLSGEEFEVFCRCYDQGFLEFYVLEIDDDLDDDDNASCDDDANDDE